MSWFYRTIVRPALFAHESEAIHNRTLATLGAAGAHPALCDALDAFYGAPELPIETFGLTFRNPVGLAAGMDNHAAPAPTTSRPVSHTSGLQNHASFAFSAGVSACIHW